MNSCQTQDSMSPYMILIHLLIVWAIYIQKCLPSKLHALLVRMPVVFACVNMAVLLMSTFMGTQTLHSRTSLAPNSFSLSSKLDVSCPPFLLHSILCCLCLSLIMLVPKFIDAKVLNMIWTLIVVESLFSLLYTIHLSFYFFWVT